MNKATTKKVIQATCAKPLQDAIERTAWTFTDVELLALAYHNASCYDERLALIKLISEHTTDKRAKQIAQSAAAYEKEKLEKFILPEKDCVYEITVDGASRYIISEFTYLSNVIAAYIGHYADVIEKEERIQLCVRKLRLADRMTAENFCEALGEASFDADLTMQHVSYHDVYNEEIDMDLYNINEEKKIPQPFHDFDIVRYGHAKPQYGIIIINEDCTETDTDCAYLLKPDQLELNGISCLEKITTKAQLFESLISAHDHIAYSQLAAADVNDLSPDLRETYVKLKALYSNCIS